MLDKWLLDLQKAAFAVESVVWAELLADLSHKTPKLDGDNLIFVPAFFHLPIHKQNQFLMLIYRQRHNISAMLLSEFIQSLTNECVPLSDWAKMIVHLLRCYCSHSSTSCNDSHSEVTSLPSTKYFDKQPHSSIADSVSDSVLCSESKAEFDNEDIASLKNIVPNIGAEHVQCSDTEIGRLSSSFVIRVEESLHPLIDGLPQSNLAIVQPDLQLVLEKAKENWIQGLQYNDLQVLNSFDAIQLESVYEWMHLEGMPETSISAVCQSFVFAANVLCVICTKIFAERCLLPLFIHLQQPASRLLASALANFSSSFSRQFVDAVLVPLVCNRNCSAHAADLVIKLVRDVFIPENKMDLLSCLLAQQTVWSEHILTAFQLIIDSKVELSDGCLHQMVTSLHKNSTECVHSASPKFGKLLLSALNLYGGRLCSMDLQVLQKAADGHKSFMKKPIVLALQKLQAL